MIENFNTFIDSITPTLYHPIKEYQTIKGIYTAIFTDIRNQVKSHNANISLVTLDEFGIQMWERDLKVTPDPNFTLEQRRNTIVSIWAGAGVKFSEENIKNLARIYDSLEVDVSYERVQGILTVTYTSGFGVPANFVDYQNLLNSLKPSHLLIRFEFRYATHRLLAEANLTHQSLEAYTHQQIREGGPL